MQQNGQLQQRIRNTITETLGINNGANIGAGGGHRGIDGHTELIVFQSAALQFEIDEASSNLTQIFNNNDGRAAIEYAYSNKHIDSKYGKYTITNGHRLYHTEPKALNTLLDIINTYNNVTHVLIVTNEDMCPGCSKFILRLMSRMDNNNFNNKNILVLGRGQFEKWTTRIGGNTLGRRNLVLDELNTSNNEVNAPNPKRGNVAVMLVRYGN